MLNLMSVYGLLCARTATFLFCLGRPRARLHVDKAEIVSMPAQCMLDRFATVMHAGEQTWYGDAGKEPDSKQRRLNLMKAVEGDDWSAVIHFQTQHTTEGLLVDDGILSVSFVGSRC